MSLQNILRNRAHTQVRPYGCMVFLEKIPYPLYFLYFRTASSTAAMFCSGTS